MRPDLRGKTFPFTLGAGFVSGILAHAFSLNYAGDLPLLFLVSLPLLLVGLSCGASSAAIAGMVSVIVSAPGKDASGLLFIAACASCVCYIFVYRALSWRDAGPGKQWYPMLKVMAQLSTLAAALLMITALVTVPQGGLASLIPPHAVDALIERNYRNADADFIGGLRQLFGPLAFMLIGAAAWLFILLLYAAATLANRILKSRGLSLRPSLAMESHGLPFWLLALNLASLLLALLGQGQGRFAAETIFIVLQLPYFLCGLAVIHAFSLKQHFFMRRACIGCFYIALLCLRWPVILVVILGLWTQLAELLDRRRKMR